MNTDTHGSKKIFCCFNKNRICGGRGISVYQCKSVANLSLLGWVLKLCALCGLFFLGQKVD